MQFEADLISFLQCGGEGWITFFKIVTLFASWLGFAVALAIIFFRDKKLSYLFFITFFVGLAINIALKFIIARPRPFDSYDNILNLGNEKGFSMPSSHALCAGMISVFICFVSFKTTKNVFTKVISVVAMLLYYALICISRMMLGVHYLTDVIVGGIVGSLLAVISILLYNIFMKKMEKRHGKDNAK